MPGAHKVEHVRLQVEDLESATAFYTDVLGLAEIAREDGTVYLGCGLDENYDLAIREGDVGLEHAAVRVEDADLLDAYEERLREEGIEATRTGGDEPGQERGLRFRLPSDLPFELVIVEDKTYKHHDVAAVEGRGGLAPLDLNHYAFHSPDVKRDVRFLADRLDFTLSETVGEGGSEGTFLRRGTKHHDVAVFNFPRNPDDRASHHHVGFTLTSVDHMVQLVDRVCQAGLDLQLGIGRHYAGNNLYSYFGTPDGHRIELDTQMADLDDNTPVNHVEDVETATSAWGELDFPESFLPGSGIVR